MKLDGAPILLLSIVAVGCLATLVRISQGTRALEGVLVVMTLGALGGVAFIMGRAHARRFRQRRRGSAEPPP